MSTVRRPLPLMLSGGGHVTLIGSLASGGVPACGRADALASPWALAACVATASLSSAAGLGSQVRAGSEVGVWCPPRVAGAGGGAA